MGLSLPSALSRSSLSHRSSYAESTASAAESITCQQPTHIVQAGQCHGITLMGTEGSGVRNRHPPGRRRHLVAGPSWRPAALQRRPWHGPGCPPSCASQEHVSSKLADQGSRAIRQTCTFASSTLSRGQIAASTPSCQNDVLASMGWNGPEDVEVQAGRERRRTWMRRSGAPDRPANQAARCRRGRAAQRGRSLPQ